MMRSKFRLFEIGQPQRLCMTFRVSMVLPLFMGALCIISTILSLLLLIVYKLANFIRAPNKLKVFPLDNDKLFSDSILVFPNFDCPFTVKINASMLGISVVLTQEGRPMEFF